MQQSPYVAGKSNGAIEVHAENLLVEEVRGHVAKVLPLIDLRDGTLVTRYLDEIHEHQEFEHESLTAECAIVIGLAVAIASYGTCSKLGTGIATSAGMTTEVMTATGATVTTLTANGSIAAAMIGASLASLTSQTIVALANSKGDLGKAAKALATKDTLKNIAIAAATAGAVKSIGLQFELPTDGEGIQKAAEAASKAENLLEVSDAHVFAGHVQSGAVHFGANVGVGTVFGGKPEDLVKSAGMTMAASVVGGFASNKIATLRDEGTLGYAGHKISHAVSGFVQDKMMGGTGIVGAATALGVEVIADAFVPHEEVKANKHGSAEAKKSLMEGVATAQNIGRMGAATAALLVGQDAKSIGIGIQVASTVLEHNSRKTAQKYLGAAGGECDEEEEAELADLSLISHLEETTGAFTVTCDDEGRPLTPRTLAAHKAAVQFAINYEKANVHQREIWRQSGYTAEEAANNAYRGEQMQLGESFVTKAALGEALTPYEQKVKNDFLIDRSVEGAAPLVFAKLGSAFTRIKEAIKGKTIHTASASAVLEKGSTLHRKVPANSNAPIRPTANTNVMPLPHVVDTTEVNGLQQLAQKLSGGARTTKDYRQIYMTSEPTRTGRLGSNGTLTLDGGTRTLNTSKTGSGKLVLDSSGNGSGSLGVFRQNSEGRWVLSTGENVSAKDLGKRPVDLIETTERTLASWEGAKASKLSTPGGVVRADAIPSGSQLEYLAPGRVKFDGVEFRAVRNLGHLNEAQLKDMSKGRNPVDIFEKRLDGHHHRQQYHRDPGAFIAEIPEPNHCISNIAQHPLGNSGGLSEIQRKDWDKLRIKFNKERARTELLRRKSND